MRPAFYALPRGGWRDYVTLLHLPYTAWHLSYVVVGGRNDAGSGIVAAALRRRLPKLTPFDSAAF